MLPRKHTRLMQLVNRIAKYWTTVQLSNQQITLIMHMRAHFTTNYALLLLVINCSLLVRFVRRLHEQRHFTVYTIIVYKSLIPRRKTGTIAYPCTIQLTNERNFRTKVRKIFFSYFSFGVSFMGRHTGWLKKSKLLYCDRYFNG